MLIPTDLGDRWIIWQTETHLVYISQPRKRSRKFYLVGFRQGGNSRLQSIMPRVRHLTSTSHLPLDSSLGVGGWWAERPAQGRQRMGATAESVSCQKAPQLRQRCRIPSLTTGAKTNPSPSSCSLMPLRAGKALPRQEGTAQLHSIHRGFGPWGG